MNDLDPLQAIEAKYGRIQQLPNGIVYLQVQDNLHVDLEIATQMVFDAKAITQSDQIRLLLLYSQNSDLTFQAQRYFASATGFTHVEFVVSSRLQAEVGQFLVTFLRSLKSTYEIKLFHNVDTAMAWLQNL